VVPGQGCGDPGRLHSPGLKPNLPPRRGALFLLLLFFDTYQIPAVFFTKAGPPGGGGVFCQIDWFGPCRGPFRASNLPFFSKLGTGCKLIDAC